MSPGIQFYRRCIFTARIRRMGEGTVFSLFVSSHLDGGGRVPQPGLDGGGTPARSGWWGGGGTPARSAWWGGRGTPARSGCWGGTPARSAWWGGYPGQVWMLGGVGVPQPGLDGGGRAVCLLRSRKRTFLLIYFLENSNHNKRKWRIR